MQLQMHCSGLAGGWLESLATLLVSQHASDASDAIISSEQCTVQENQVPNSNRAIMDFSARTLLKIMIGKTDSTAFVSFAQNKDCRKILLPMCCHFLSADCGSMAQLHASLKSCISKMPDGF